MLLKKIFSFFFRPIYQELMLKVSIVIAGSYLRDFRHNVKLFECFSTQTNAFWCDLEGKKTRLKKLGIKPFYDCSERMENLKALADVTILFARLLGVSNANCSMCLKHILNECCLKIAAHSSGGDFTSIARCYDIRALMIATYMGFLRGRNIHLTLRDSI